MAKITVDKSGKATVEGDSLIAKILKQQGKVKMNSPLRKNEYEIVDELPKPVKKSVPKEATAKKTTKKAKKKK